MDHAFLSEAEHQELLAGQYFLWEVRFLLHILTGRKEERLLFDHQTKLAAHFGYRDEEPRHAVEKFMKRYYRHIMELQRLNEMLLQHFQEAILYADDLTPPQPINRRFQSRKGFLEVTDENTFIRYPFAMLEIFLLLQQHPEIKGIRAATIRLMRTARERMDDAIRRDLRARSLFMEILRQPQGITQALRGLNRNGILAAYLPVFERIVGQMQYDLFHIYTVDEHTLRVVRNLRRFTVPAHYHEFPLCSAAAQRIPKLELLYLAGLFHDIAKGRNGDHSELGARDATEFCQAHYLSQRDTELVAWLVRNHLLMSTTAQRQDIADPEVINTFAQLVGDQVRLDYLYLLTVADIRSTNPEIWNSWKNSLLQDLYHMTSRALRRGIDHPLDRDERVRGVKWLARNLLRERKVDEPASRAIWERLGDDYFLRYSAEEIAWHTEAIVNTADEALPLVLARQEPNRGSSSIFIYSQDMENFFARATSLLGQLHLNIVDARIVSSSDDYTFDTYLLLEDTNEPITDPQRLQHIQEALRLQLTAESWEATAARKRVPRQLRHFPMATEISFSQDESSGRTILEVITADRPGLLSRIGFAFAELGIDLENAKITTLVNRAEDVFFVTDRDGQPITDADEQERIRHTLLEFLDEGPGKESGDAGAA